MKYLMYKMQKQDVTERSFFFSEGSNGADKNEFVSQFTASFVYTRHVSHKHQKMTMNNILTSGGLNTMSFFIIRIFREYVT